MNPSTLFEANLATIERVIAIVCRRSRLYGEDAEDFASEAKLALIENDYAVMASYEGRSSLDTYLTVVIQRLLADSRTRAKGRWHASMEAQRLGPAAVLLETLVRRDGRSLDEALPHMHAAHPELSRDQLQAMLDRLPERSGRPRPVDLEAVAHAVVARESADAGAMASESERISNAAGSAVRAFLSTVPPEDRLLVRLRFGSDMSVADIARMTCLPQRPLYRRLESLLVRLRSTLADAGVDRNTAEGLVGRDTALDFGLANGKSGTAGQSMHGDEP